MDAPVDRRGIRSKVSAERIKARARSISAPSNERVIYRRARKGDGLRREGRVE